MTAIRKFLFDESFDVADQTPHSRHQIEAPPPPPPTFNEEEVQAAREAAYQEGMAAGREAGIEQGNAEGQALGLAEGIKQGREAVEHESEALLARALNRIGVGVELLLAGREEVNAARTGQTMQITMSIVRKLMPEMTRRGGLEEIEAVVRSCMAELVDEPRLVVRVSETMLEAVRERLEFVSGFDTKLVVIGDGTFGPSDCRVEWGQGGAERETTQLISDVEQCVERFLGTSAA